MKQLIGTYRGLVIGMHEVVVVVWRTRWDARRLANVRNLVFVKVEWDELNGCEASKA